MKTKSAKAKGRSLQNFVRDWLRGIYALVLEDDDIKAQTMGMTGMDIVLSPAAKKFIPFAIECKNMKRPNILAAYRQAKTHTVKTNLYPVAIIQAPGNEKIVTIPFELFDKLVRGEDNGA